MPACVADASVVAALVFGEPQAGEAARLLKGAELFEPTLLPYELASVARKKALRYPKDRESILQALRLGLNLDARWVEVDHAAAAALALEKGVTVYDAAYLWTARLCGVKLLTFDQRLRAAV